MRNRRFAFKDWAAVVGMVALSGLSSVAQADTVKAKLTVLSPAQTVQYTLAGNNGSTTAGVFNWSRNSPDGGTDTQIDSTFATFCIELTQNITYNTTYAYDVINLDLAPKPGGSGSTSSPSTGMGALKAKYIRELWGRYHDDIDTSAEAAAFQLSIWEIVYDGPGAVTGLALSDGNFKARYASVTGYATIAQGWLSTLTGAGTFSANLVAISNDTRQDQVTELVPLPLAAWAGMAMFGLIGAARLRRSRAMDRA